MISCQKDRFSIAPEITYLNCAYMSPMTRETEAAGIKGVFKKKEPYQLVVDDFFKPVEQLRKSLASLINEQNPDRIVLIPSASYGLANAAANLHPSPHQNIILVGEQFPSNVFAWHKLAAGAGCELRVVNPPEGTKSRGSTWNQAILHAIDPQTAVVAMAPLHWADGTLFDLAKIRAKTRMYGAALVIDGTQAVGAMPFDVEKLQPDAVICAGYKWLLGPYGMGFAWYGPRFDNGLPIENNWINRLHSDEFSDLSSYEGQYRPAAQRYGMGETSNFITVPMLQAGVNHLLEWGVANIQEYCTALVADPVLHLQEKGFIIEESAFRASHLFGIRLPKGASMDEVFNKFEKANIKVSRRGNAIRVSPHLYNDANDMDKLVSCLVD